MKKSCLQLIILLILISSFASASLGISPAKKEYAFASGEDIVIIYTVSTDTQDKILNIYADGELSKYARLSKTQLKGPGSFTLTLSLPYELEQPGEHKLLVGVRELPDESQFLGTAVNIKALVKINVPYPGKYIEPILSVPDGNINEKIPVELHAINRGKEDVLVSPIIEFLSDGKTVHTMSFTPANINISGDRYFRKFLDTDGYSPGEYIANAIVDYSGEKVKVNQTFRIGSLFMNIVNFTQKLPKGSIQRFNIDVENRWNGKMEGVYADVNITNNLENITFRTPSIDLEAWQLGTLTGFIDTNDLEGSYNAKIILNYAGQQTITNGILTIYTTNYLMIIIIIGIILIILMIAIILFILIKRRRK